MMFISFSLGENVCDVLASLMAILAQNSIFGQNPKIGCQECNDLQTPKLSKKQLCDRTLGGGTHRGGDRLRNRHILWPGRSDLADNDGSHPPNSLMDSIQEICKTYHDAIRVTNFAISLAPFGILRGARVKALRPEVLVQSIDALYAEDPHAPSGCPSLAERGAG